jgi:predicted CoA-binding protein
MIDQRSAEEFLASGRIAVVGASDDPKNFGGTILRELLAHGIDAVAVNPQHDLVAGRPCVPTVRDLAGTVDGVIVMVPGQDAVDTVQAAIDRGVGRVWLFKGIGGAGAASAEAIELCERHEIQVIAGACPLMFLEPVKGAHRFHHTIRRLNRSLRTAS